MKYEGRIFRPPSEAYSLILQVTIGCSYNQCTFCSSFREKQFRMRTPEELADDLDAARAMHHWVKRIYLSDADALVIPAETMLWLLNYIRQKFPECERVSTHGSARDILRRTPEELRAFRAAGLGMIYMGAESGSDEILRRVHKGATRAQMIEAVRRTEEAGILASLTFISGLGGTELWREHAVETGTAISEMCPSYVSLLTLLLEPGTPLYEDDQAGKFQPLTPEEVARETRLLLEHINVTTPCVFRSNHASNYLSLSGELPRDKAALLRQLDGALHFKPDSMRRF